MLNVMLAAIQFVTVDPGHFHAALVQNRTYEGVSPEVLVYAPEGGELKSHLSLIDQFNTRAANPTAWKETVYAGADFLEKFSKDAAKRSAAENARKIVVLAGTNLPMLITAATMIAFESDPKALADEVMFEGKDNIVRFELTVPAAQDEEEDGI